jgi:hypothetical protein
MPIIDEAKAFAPDKVMMVMLQEICVFTMNAGDVFSARLFKTKTPK